MCEKVAHLLVVVVFAVVVLELDFAELVVVVFPASSSFFFDEELDFVVVVLVEEELGFGLVVVPPWLEDALLPVVVPLAPELVEVASVVTVEEEVDEEVAGLPLPEPAVFQ